MIGLAVRRPVAVTMVYAAVALLGVAAWRDLPVELLPDTELPRLTVAAVWPGASPETVERFLTAPLEAVLHQIRGVARIASVSEEASARVTLEFDPDVDMQFVRLELRERLSTVESELPPGVRGPWVEAYVPGEFREQSRSFMRYTLTGPYTVEALRALVDLTIAPALREVENVAEVVPAGGRGRLLEVEVNDARMHSLGVAPERVRVAAASLDVSRQGGAVDVAGVRRPLSIREDIDSIAQLLSAAVTADSRHVVHLRDLATIRDTYEDPAAHYRVDGRPAVSFEVVRAIGSNAVRVADAVRAEAAEREPQLPRGVRLILDEDESEAIRAQLGDLRFRATIAAGVIFVVLRLFLKSALSTTIVFVTIAFSVLTTLNLVHFSGMSLNILTLMGFALGFGLIVDNAIVVLENVHARSRSGDAPEVAAERGAREVVLPLLAATATTVIVVAPFVWLQGELRAYYVPLAIVVAFSLAASLAVAFTFIPAIAARLLPTPVPNPGASPGARVDIDGCTAATDAMGVARVKRDAWYACVYAGLVGFAVRRPWVPILLAVGALGGSYHLFDSHVPRGLPWSSWWSEGTYISIQIALPRGAEIERTDRYARFFEDRLGAMPEIDRFTTSVTATGASIQVTFPDSIAQTGVPVIVKEQLVAHGHLLGGAEVRVYGFGPTFYRGGSSRASYSIAVLGYDYEKVRDIAEDLGGRLRRFSRVRDIDTNSWGRWDDRDRATELVLRLDHDRLALHGLSAREVVSYVATATRGSTRGDVIQVAGEERLLRVKLGDSRDMDVLALEQMPVPTPGGGEVRVGEIAALEEREVMSRIVRENQQYRRLVRYEFRGPRELGDRHHEAVMQATALPAGFAVDGPEAWSWDAEDQRQIRIVIAAALILVFMTTAALFESLRQPFIVLLTVPMALIGVFLMFWLTGASFTREACIGVIMMGGIVVNNAILLVDHVNRLAREHGLPLREAAMRGSLDRVRPILMTSATTILGLLPLVLFSESADANIWNALGYALIGGLTSSTLLVLTVTPALLTVSAPRPGSSP